MKIDNFSQFLLGVASPSAFAFKVRPKAGEHFIISFTAASSRHAILWRRIELTPTPLYGVLYLGNQPVNLDQPNFLRRIGPDPHANGRRTNALYNCPDIWEVEDGFAVIGIDMTTAALPRLPATASCGPDERVVWIPRDLLIRAKPDIPAS